MNRTDGGPAFPVMVERTALSNNDNYVTVREPEGGMSLRDYFAASVAGDVLNHPNATDGSPRAVVSVAYQIADAMLAERAKGTPS